MYISNVAPSISAIPSEGFFAAPTPATPLWRFAICFTLRLIKSSIKALVILICTKANATTAAINGTHPPMPPCSKNKKMIDGKTTDFHETVRSEEHTSELQSQFHLVCRLLLEKKTRNRGN